ncbi:hypothetical protein [Streptomyces sp. NBC_01497]|uniref:hypothetical protein n=1 Tax=Streptomyces sp. NBC_01497 TaxID=2903885 RepID=UPI002E3684FD|nr:hypothetical protein [Streptomyces sp. NBC_01497]
MKKYILFDHDGVLVDTEFWYFRSAERALADAGFTLDKDQYLRDMVRGSGSWAQARAAGVDDRTLGRFARPATATTRSTCGPRPSRSMASSMLSSSCRSTSAWPS